VWRDVLEQPKEKFWLFIATVNGFPTCEDGVQEVADCLDEALD
jgi:hypothetical protein